MAKPKVFISYRRSDSQAQTGRLYDRLNRAFPGMFFRDVSEIGVGVDFVNQIDRAIGGSVALIAVIGQTWANAAGDRGRRLDDPDDPVRVEIRAALTRKIRIIPVLLGNTEMLSDDQLPDDLKPLTRWNAIRIVEEYYDEGIEKLVRSLVPELGEPAHLDGEQHNDAKVTALRGEAEAAIGVEDWFAAIQALQAALSLQPTNLEISARLKWANEQRKVSGLYTDAQGLYEKGKKAAALARFRQVKVAGGDYRGVNDLIDQIEREVKSQARRSTMRRWTFGLVTGVVSVVTVVVVLIVLHLRKEFANINEVFDPDPNVPSQQVQPVGNMSKSNPGPEPPPEAPDRTRFSPSGRFRVVNQGNQQLSFILALNSNSTFQVQANAGTHDVPLSGGMFTYDPSSGLMLLSGINKAGELFAEPMQIYEKHADHFHVTYAGTQWDLLPE